MSKRYKLLLSKDLTVAHDQPAGVWRGGNKAVLIEAYEYGYKWRVFHPNGQVLGQRFEEGVIEDEYVRRKVVGALDDWCRGSGDSWEEVA